MKFSDSPGALNSLTSAAASIICHFEANRRIRSTLVRSSFSIMSSLRPCECKVQVLGVESDYSRGGIIALDEQTAETWLSQGPDFFQRELANETNTA
jgi:hypothetical protein